MSAEASGVRPVTRTRTCEFYVRDDGVVVQAFVAPGPISVDDARANLRLLEQLAEGQPRRLLIELDPTTSAEPGVRELYVGDPGSRLVRALALVSGSTSQRVRGSVGLWLARPSYPCRIFGSSADAAAWLLDR